MSRDSSSSSSQPSTTSENDGDGGVVLAMPTRHAIRAVQALPGAHVRFEVYAPGGDLLAATDTRKQAERLVALLDLASAALMLKPF